MNDKDLDDLAMLAICHHRLAVRARERCDFAASEKIIDAASDAMHILCKAAGIDDLAVMERAEKIIDAARSPLTSAVH